MSFIRSQLTTSRKGLIISLLIYIAIIVLLGFLIILPAIQDNSFDSEVIVALIVIALLLGRIIQNSLNLKNLPSKSEENINNDSKTKNSIKIEKDF